MAANGNGDESDEIVNILCCICEKKNITREAEKYCVECRDYYCVPCADMHKMFLPTSSGHELLDRTDVSTVRPCMPTEKCPLHVGKVLDMYCKNHDEVACATCVAITHRTCEDIHSITDEIDDLYQQSVADATKTQLHAAKIAIGGVNKIKANLIHELKAHRGKAVDLVREFRKEMDAVVEKLETESIGDIEEEYGIIETSLQEEIKAAENCAYDLEQSASKLMKSDGNKAQVFICVKIAEKNMDVARHLGMRRDVEIKFQPDLKIRSFLRKLKNFGQVCVPQVPGRPKTNFCFPQAPCEPKTTVYTVKQQKEIDVKLETDERICWILGSCFTSDGWLLLADDNNKRLKRVDLSTESINDHLDMEDGCIGICQTAKHEVAVSCRNETIQFVSLGDEMAITRKLEFDHECFGLAYRNDRLFISDSQYAVYIHGMNGDMLEKIRTDKSGNKLFRAARHIAVSGDNVYVADYHNGLISLDLQGNYKSTFTDTDLNCPFGICTDGRGNIIANGCGLSNIVQVSENPREKMGVLGQVEDGMSVCFYSHQKKLYASQDNSDTVKVYELE